MQTWDYEPNDVADRLERDLEIAAGRIKELEQENSELRGYQTEISPATAVRGTLRDVAKAHGYPNLCPRGRCDVCDGNYIDDYLA